MFVQNLDKLILANSYVSVYGSSDDNKTLDVFKVKDVTGSLITPGFKCYNNANHVFNTKIFLYDNVLFGDSDIAEDYVQYNVQGNNITINDLSIARYYSIDDDGIMELACRITGTPQANAIAKEIALTKKIYTNSGTPEYSDIMMYREVLKTPITFTQNTQIDMIFKIRIPSIR